MVGRVPVNATIGDGSPSETAADTREAADRGFGTCKLKVGIRSVEEDVEQVRRAGEATGSGVTLRADANEAWTFEEAETALEAFDEIGSRCSSNRFRPALEGHAALQARSDGVMIAVDEGCSNTASTRSVRQERPTPSC